MKIFRTIAAAFLALLGVMMIVTWGFSVKSVEAIENGEAAANITNKLLSSPHVAEVVADRATAEIYASLDAQFDSPIFDRLWGLVEGSVHSSVESFISSDFVAEAAQAGANKAQAGLVEALTTVDRPEGPLLLTIDVSPRINARIDQIPRVGQYIPEITVPSVSIEVIDAATFEDMRTAYQTAKWAATWFVWIGLALLVLGVLVAPRRGWFLARALLVAGLVIAAVGFTVQSVGSHTIAQFMPGGASGGLGIAVDDLLSDTAIPVISNLLIRLGVVALVLALITGLIVRFLPSFRDRAKASREKNSAPIVHSPSNAQPASEREAASTRPLPVAVGAVAASLPTSVPSSLAVPDETLAHPREDDAPEGGEEAVTEAVAPAASAATAATVATPVAEPVAEPATKSAPVAKKPAAKKPPAKPATKAAPVAKKPAAKKPAAKPAAEPAAKAAPAAKKPAAAKASTTKAPAAKKPATRKPAAKKPAKTDEPPTTA